MICKHSRRLESQPLTSEGRLLVGVLVAFAVMAVLAAVDLGIDLAEGTTLLHVLAEGAVFGFGLVGSIVVARRFVMLARRERDLQREANDLADQLKATEAEAERWRAEASELLAGLGAAIDRQFERWGLTEAEKEVALLLLKGLSHKEIAEVRAITEATARQQARAVYRKGGLAGRAELAAFFLEDLLLPHERQ